MAFHVGEPHSFFKRVIDNSGENKKIQEESI